MLDKWEKRIEEPIDVSKDVSLMTLDTMLRCAMSSETNCQQTKYGVWLFKSSSCCTWFM